LKDEIKLLDGSGDLWLVDEQSVYEEGETITFGMDTGFSGYTQGGDVSDQGWELRVYDAQGDRVKTWDIGDDKRNLERSYVIPDDAYDPEGSNTWKVELWNTLFDQSERYFFTIGAGMGEQKPRLPTITFDKSSYDMGDICYVTVQSEPNSNTDKPIYEFFVKAYYGTSGVDYVYLPKYVSASGNQASFSFTMTRGDRYVTVEANAFDGPHNAGGIPSETGKNSVYVKDKDPEPDTFTLNVYVRFDGELVSDAVVECGGKTVETDSGGKAIFVGLPKDTYTVKAHKEKIGTGSEQVVLDQDKSITINLSPTGELDYFKLVVAEW